VLSPSAASTERATLSVTSIEPLQNGTALQSVGAGALLRRWREARHLSQLEVDLEAEVSARHISFLETGRAEPSWSMPLTLAKVLDVPLREQNFSAFGRRVRTNLWRDESG
jgi:transcriptional regulator with XRE-family HTH domain